MTTDPRPEPQKRLSLDEIMNEISQVAMNETGADKFRALKMLASMQSSGAILPPALGDQEVVERLSRLMIGAGTVLTQAAYTRAFPHAVDADYAGRKLVYGDATPEMRREADKVTSLRVLNKTFPDFKIGGVPKGFPSGQSAARKIEWCRNQALKYLIERERAARQGAHDAMTAADTEIRGATEGPPIDRPEEALQEP